MKPLNHPKSLLLAAALTQMAGCSDSNPDFYRTSANLPSEDWIVNISAQVHTHLGQSRAEDETHTTLSMDVLGAASKGYYYSVELADDDQASAMFDGTSVPLIEEKLPSNSNPLAVYYYQDFDITEDGTTFTVTIDRKSDATLHSVDIALPTTTDMTLTPTGDTLTFSDTVTVEWQALNDQDYSLQFAMLCYSESATQYYATKTYPNASTPTLASPFTFAPSNHFDVSELSSEHTCELHTSLVGSISSDATEQMPFRATNLYSQRQHKIIKTLQMPSP